MLPSTYDKEINILFQLRNFYHSNVSYPLSFIIMNNKKSLQKNRIDKKRVYFFVSK